MFPFYKQLNAMDCGPTCLRMIAKYYGKHYNAAGFRKVSGYSKLGTSMLGISKAAEEVGFRTYGVQLTYDQLVKDVTLPGILHWDQNHFVVFVPHRNKRRVTVADPARGVLTYDKSEFVQHWISSREPGNIGGIGTALLMEPTPAFFEQEGEANHQLSWGLILKYLKGSKRQLMQVFAALVIASILQLAFPFLTQSIVDIGVNTRNLRFISVVLIAQLTFMFSKAIVDFIRSRLLLRISSMANLAILSDFWIKLTRLPISYYDSYHTGDTLQRINDNKQVQSFLTGSAISTLFSLLNFSIYALVLLFYSAQLFFIFIGGGLAYFLWIRTFLRFRRKINYQQFRLSARENSATLQLVQGMQEIKLSNAEQQKRWEWESLQAGLFNLGFKNLSYGQLQQAGAILINQGKDLLLTFLVAQMVIEGKLTLGAMLAIQYILGQLSGPIEQFISFVQNAQDAKISLERLNDIYQLQDEESPHSSMIDNISGEKALRLEDVSFSYEGAGGSPVLKGISLEIPEGKTTAIVGVSGSGKTTLLKLLLKFYDQYKGELFVGKTNLRFVSPSFWRGQCGVVLQDGFIFNDTIANNIAVGQGAPQLDKLAEATRIANIASFVESLPNGYNTLLGTEGMGISQGQRQRLLIARAIYKNTPFLFFDEATNSLDANNERSIVEHLREYTEGRTVVVVAHRLSTVMQADKIVVLHEGRIVEEGTHFQLSLLRGKYFELVKNQLELGN